MASVYPEERYVASADARCGVWATFVVAGDGIESSERRRQLSLSREVAAVPFGLKKQKPGKLSAVNLKLIFLVFIVDGRPSPIWLA